MRLLKRFEELYSSRGWSFLYHIDPQIIITNDGCLSASWNRNLRTHMAIRTCPILCNNCTEGKLQQKLIVYFRLVRPNYSSCKAKPQCRKGILPSPWFSPKTFFFLCSYQATAKKRHSHLNARLSDNLKAEFTLALFYISRVWKSRNLREKKKKK